jgi:alkylation response protein AidB-like acyl-CoA dehydrogenase
MRQPGVLARPLRQMNGHASFNEVFFDGAVVPAGDVLGEVGAGWSVALTVLAHERRVAPRPGDDRQPPGRTWREFAAETAELRAPYVWYPQRAGRPDLLVAHARAAGRAQDPLVRQEIARVTELALTARWTAERAAAARTLGRPPGPEGSLGKLASSVVARASAGAHALIAGADGMLAGPGSPMDGVVAEITLSVPAVSIAGGTDEIQRNILGERVLGLPREPAVDRDVPFREVRTDGTG